MKNQLNTRSTNSSRSRIAIELWVIIMIALPASTSWAETETPGKIKSVTVYLDQARVVREITIAASDDPQRVRVTGLPQRLVTNSAFTESDDGVLVQSMQVLSRLMNPGSDAENADKIKALIEKQEDLKKRLRTSQNDLKVIQQDLSTIEKMVDFSANRSKQDLDRATLDVQSLTQLTEFSIERRRKLAAEMFEKETEIDALSKDMEENQRQQARLSAYRSRPTMDAVMTVNSKAGGTVRLMYDVSHVNWTPQYNVRAATDGDKNTFRLLLDAMVYQETGESWNDVQLTIATRLPDAQASRPLLTPLRVQAVQANQQANAQQINRTLVRSTSTGQSTWIDPDLMQRNLRLNLNASRRQVSELTKAAEVQRQLADDATAVTDEAYVIEGAVTIPSRPQLQTINILSEEIDGELNRVVTPLLSSFAFREAKLMNASGRHLISGSAKVYLNGAYVGKTTLPPTAAGQRLVIGLGTDRKIRTRRELLSRDETIQGGNRSTALKYRLVVSNYHERDIDIQLVDRIPVAAKDGSINVSLDGEAAEALSDDKLYRRMQRPTGVLRWDLAIPAKRFGSEAFDHEYQYSIEMDRQQTIVSQDLSRMASDLQFEKSSGGGMGGMGGGGAF